MTDNTSDDDDPFALFDGSSDDDDDDNDEDEEDNYQAGVPLAALKHHQQQQHPLSSPSQSSSSPSPSSSLDYDDLLATIKQVTAPLSQNEEPSNQNNNTTTTTPRWFTTHPPLKMGPIESIDTLSNVGGSRGYVAARHAIPAGTLILRERVYIPWPNKTRTATLFVDTVRKILLKKNKKERDDIMTNLGHFYPQRLEDLPDEVLDTARREYTSLLQPLVREHNDDDDDEICLDDLLQLVMAMQSNAFGSGVFLHCSIFNHSCDPNCVKYTLPNDNNSISEVRACRDIAKGDAVTISYLLPLEQLKRTRQDRLQRQFGFMCSCTRCEREKEEDEETLDSHVTIERQLLDVSSRGGNNNNNNNNNNTKPEQILPEMLELLSDGLECLPPRNVLFIGIHQLLANACADLLQQSSSSSSGTNPAFLEHAIVFLRSTWELWKLQQIHLNPLHLDLTRTYADLSHGIQLLLSHDSQRLYDEFPQWSTFQLASRAEYRFRQCHEALRQRYES